MALNGDEMAVMGQTWSLKTLIYAADSVGCFWPSQVIMGVESIWKLEAWMHCTRPGQIYKAVISRKLNWVAILSAMIYNRLMFYQHVLNSLKCYETKLKRIFFKLALAPRPKSRGLQLQLRTAAYCSTNCKSENGMKFFHSWKSKEMLQKTHWQ